MTFDSLINVKMPEAEIFDRVVEILQRNFSAYHDVNVCLELGDAEGDICFVKNVRFYKLDCEKDVAAKQRFMYRGEFEKVYVMTKFEKDCYITTLFGHFTYKSGDVFFNDVKYLREIKDPIDHAKKKMHDHEMVAKAFDEIKGELLKKKTG